MYWTGVTHANFGVGGWVAPSSSTPLKLSVNGVFLLKSSCFMPTVFNTRGCFPPITNGALLWSILTLHIIIRAVNSNLFHNTHHSSSVKLLRYGIILIAPIHLACFRPCISTQYTYPTHVPCSKPLTSHYLLHPISYIPSLTSHLLHPISNTHNSLKYAQG